MDNLQKEEGNDICIYTNKLMITRIMIMNWGIAI